MIWFSSLFFILFVYGMSVIVTQGIGPANIFLRLREWADDVNDNFGLLFRCMLCFPTNAGIAMSLFDWFLIPSVALSPFNILLGSTNLWWLAAIADGCVAAGISHLLWNIDDYIDKITPDDSYEYDEGE